MIHGGPLFDAFRPLSRLPVVLPYEEVGAALEVAPAAARKRYGRALLRLRTLVFTEDGT